MRTKATLVTLAVGLLAIGLTHFVVSSTVKKKVKRQVVRKLRGNFGAVWERLELDGQAAVRRADQFSLWARRDVGAFVSAQEALSDYLEGKAAALPPDKRPDVVLVVVHGKSVARILGGYVSAQVLPKNGRRQDLYNVRFQPDLVQKIFTAETKKSASAPGNAFFPAGWVGPGLTVGRLPKTAPLGAALASAAVAPLVVPFDAKKGRPAPGGEPKRLAAVLVGWKHHVDKAVVKEVATALATDQHLRLEAFWKVYHPLRVRLVEVFLNEASAELQRSGRTPDFLAMVDAKGVMLFRNKGTEYLVGENLMKKYLVLANVLRKGISQSDIWVYRDLTSQTEKEKTDLGNTLLRVGVSPVFANGRPAAAFIVGWTIGAKMADLLSKQLGLQVAFLLREGFVASSSKLPVLSKSLIATMLKNRVTSKASDSGKWEGLEGVPVSVRGRKYLAAAGLVAGTMRPSDYSFVIFVPYDTFEGPFRIVPVAVWVLGLLLVFLALLMEHLIWQHFVRAIDEIYNGVNEIVSGNKMDYSFGVPSEETEGLCYALNTLLAKLLGRPEEEDEEEGGEDVDRPQVSFRLGPMPERPVPASDPGASALAAEADQDHHKRIYAEYVAALQAEGHDVSAFTFEDFQAKLLANERMIKAKYGCTKVRFRVETSGGEVVLTPVPIQ